MEGGEEKGKGGKGEGREGRTPQGLGDTPHFQILKNTLYESYETIQSFLFNACALFSVHIQATPPFIGLRETV